MTTEIDYDELEIEVFKVMPEDGAPTKGQHIFEYIEAQGYKYNIQHVTHALVRLRDKGFVYKVNHGWHRFTDHELHNKGMAPLCEKAPDDIPQFLSSPPETGPVEQEAAAPVNDKELAEADGAKDYTMEAALERVENIMKKSHTINDYENKVTVLCRLAQIMEQPISDRLIEIADDLKQVQAARC